MKSLNCKQLKFLTDEISSKIRNNHISSITVVNSTDIIFGFSFYRCEKLLVSINHTNPFMCLIKTDLSLSTQQCKLNEALRNNAKDSFLTNINTINNDRIVVVSIQFSDEMHIKHNAKMIIELIPHHPNLIIVNEDNVIMFANHYTSLTSKRVILKNYNYSEPSNTNKYEADYLIPEIFFTNAQSYISEMISIRTNEQFKSLKTLIQKQLKTATRKQEVLEAEIDNAKLKLSYKEHADYLSAFRQDTTEINKYLSVHNLSFDPILSINDNIDKFYSIYKKSKKTILYNTDQIQLNEKEILKLKDELLLFVNNDTNGLIELSNQKLKTKLKPINPINQNVPFYINIKDGKIYYGKNADQNDFVSFKIAKNKDIFFHIKDYSGSHVILSKDTPSNEDILLCAELAIYLSKKEIGEVNYTRVCEIKKGPKPGLVILSSYKSIVIKIIHNETKQLLKESKRFSS